MSKSIVFSKEYFKSRAQRLKNDDLNKRLIKFIEPKKDMKILDVGTGTGYFAEILQLNLKDPDITAIDTNHEMLEIAKKNQIEERKHIKLSEIRFVEEDAYSMNFEDNEFDLVTCHNFLVYIIKPKMVIEEMYRVLKPGGLLAVVEPSFSDAFYQPQFTKRMRELEKKATDSFNRALEEEGLNRRVVPRIPQMMLDAGLSDVESIGHLMIRLACEKDNLEEELNHIKYLKANDEKINGLFYNKMLEGGLTFSELKEFREGLHEWWDKVIEDPDVLKYCGEYREIKIVAVKGRKPLEENE